MFDLLDRPLFYLPVKWPGVVPGDDGGATLTEHMVEIQVELLDREEFNAWMIEGSKDVEDMTAEERQAHELTTIKGVAKGWRKIKANGRNPDFSDENIAKLLGFPGFVSAFGEAYMNAWNAKIEIRSGNSEGSPANGQADGPTGATSKAATPRKPRTAKN